MNQPAFSRASADAIMVGAPEVPSTRGPPVRSRRQAHDDASGASTSALVARRLAEDHDRIARGLNDLVVRRIFAAGLDLQAALLLIGDHAAASRIHDAVGQLDQAITDIRDTIFS